MIMLRLEIEYKQIYVKL